MEGKHVLCETRTSMTTSIWLPSSLHVAIRYSPTVQPCSPLSLTMAPSRTLTGSSWRSNMYAARVDTGRGLHEPSRNEGAPQQAVLAVRGSASRAGTAHTEGHLHLYVSDWRTAKPSRSVTWHDRTAWTHLEAASQQAQQPAGPPLS